MVWRGTTFTAYVNINIGCGSLFCCKGGVCVSVRLCPHYTDETETKEELRQFCNTYEQWCTQEFCFGRGGFNKFN